MHCTFTDGIEQCLPRAVGHFRAHEDADLLERLPFSVEGQKGTDFEVPRGYVERRRDSGPLFEIAQTRPAGDAVVDDKEVVALGVSSH